MALCLPLLAALCGQLGAQIIAFDDLPDTTSGQAVPAGYAGLQWNNFYYMDGVGDVGNSGYPAATVSPRNVIYNSYGNPASITSPVPFDLLSAYLTSAHLDNLVLEIKGLTGGALKYDTSYTLSATAPTLITMNYLGVDEVDFISSGGTQHPGYRPGGQQFAMDNLTVKLPPPDLVATDVYFRDQPSNQGNRVDDPVVGQQLYAHFSYTLTGHDVGGTIWEIDLDGLDLGSYTTSDLAPGPWVGWQDSPWTVTSGTHTLRGVLDPGGTILESNETNNIATTTFTSAEVQPLHNNVPMNGLAGVQGSQKAYKITVPAGQGRLSIGTSGGAGDSDLYVKCASVPTLSNYDWSSTGSTTTESVIVNNPAAADWYILVYGSSAYSGVTVTAAFGTADLAAAQASINQTTVAAGDVLTVTLTVTNQGTMVSDATEVYFYFRTNQNDFSSAAYVGELDLPALNAATQLSGLQFAYALPLNTPVDTYAMSYWIDGPGLVRESNKNNNTSTWPAISVTGPPLRPLTNGVPWSGQFGLQGSQKLYKVTVPSGQKSLTIATTGGSGDCDLYVSFGAWPTTSSYGYRSAAPGNNETVGIVDPAAGDWYVLLYSYAAYSGLAITASYVPPQQIVVTNVNDTGPGSLRQAITDANGAPGLDAIAFRIPGAGPHTITLASPLPAITDPVVIDGYTQPGASPATLSDKNDAVLLIELDGASAGSAACGLQLQAAGSTVRGLVINRFGASGILISGTAAGGNLVEGNFVGTDIYGALRQGNGARGIDVVGSPNTLIRTNVISANGSDGIRISGSCGDSIQGNLIGTDATGTNALGNVGNGILMTGDLNGGTNNVGRNILSGNFGNGLAVDATGYTIYEGPLFIGTDATATQDLGNYANGIFIAPPGTFTPHADDQQPGPPAQLVEMNQGRTIVAFNHQNGVAMTTSSSDTRWSLIGYSFFSNGLLAIDLGNDGVTANDPCDSDTASGGYQNFPVLSSAVSTGTGITIAGFLNSLPNATFIIEFFANEQCDPSGFGEGQFFLGSINLTNAGSCIANFQVTFNVPVPVGYSATAKAARTDPDGFGRSSEFGRCVAVTAAGPTATTLAASSVTATAATLNGSVTPNGSGVTACFEYGTSSSYGSTTAPAQLGGGAQTLAYSLSGLTPGTTYHYRLDASNSVGTVLGNDVTFTTASPPTGSQPAWVSGTGGLGLRLRAAPSLSSAVLAVMPEGSEFTLLGQSQRADGYLWFNGQFGGQTGWAASEYLVLTPSGAVPSAPTALQQLKADGTTPIPAGGNLNGNSVVLAAAASGPSSEELSVQFEVRPMGAAFSAPTHQSGFVTGGSQASVTVSDLSSQGYHWRARTVDGSGQTSGWVPFGSGTSPDFMINPAAVLSSLFDWSPAIPLAGSPVQFTAQAASQARLTFQWNFGGGGSATGPSVSETFAQAGPVTVTLTVTDANGNQAASTETVPVASPALQDAINKLAQSTSTLLDQISSQAQEAAAAADDFQADVKDTETESVISAAFALINAGATAGELAGWVEKTFASEAANELVGDAAGDADQRLASWVAGRVVGGSQTYASLFGPGIKGFVAQKKAEIEQLRQSAVAASAALGSDQAAQLGQGLRARYAGNVAISADYSEKVDLPVIFDQIKQADESSWSWRAADISFDIGVTAAQAALNLATGSGASGVLGAMVSIDSTLGRGAVDQATILAGVSMDAQMLATSVGVAGQATISAGLMATNAENGLEDVIQNRAPAVPQGQMSVQPIAQGWLSAFGFSPVWATTKPYAKVTIQNTGTVPASYFVEALYPKTYTTEQLLPFYTGGLFDRDYALNVVSSANPVQLDAAGQQTVEIDFLEIPNGAIMYTLTAATAGGVYLEAMVQGEFGTMLVDTNGQAIDHSQVPQDLLEDLPVSSTIVEYGNSVSCLLDICVRNPTASPMLLDLQQGLPTGTVVIDAGGGTMGANQLAWDLNLGPGESSLVESALMLPSQSVALSNTIALAYDEINTAWVQFEAIPAVIQVAQSPPPTLQAIGLTSQGFSLNLQTIAPGVYRVEATRDFRTWAPVATCTNFQSSVTVVDTGATTNTVRFYRAVMP